MIYNKLFVVVLFAFILLCFASCSHNENQEPYIYENSTEENSQEVVISSKETDLTRNEKNSIQNVVTDSDVGGTDDNFESMFDEYKYRYIYYSVYAPFVEIVGEDKYYDWLYAEYETVEFSERNEMAIVAFIKKFNVSREDFDRANKKSIDIFMEYGGITVMNPAEEDPYYDRDLECREIYNADIIYTFDNELINSYYLYVDPGEKEASSEQY